MPALSTKPIDISSRGKSEVITLRVSPKVKFGLDIRARLNSRTLAQTAELAIQRMLGLAPSAVDAATEALEREIIEKLWSPHRGARFVNLVRHHPELMTYEEESRWHEMARAGLFDEAFEAPLSRASTLRAGADLRRLEDSVDAFLEAL